MNKNKIKNHIEYCGIKKEKRNIENYVSRMLTARLQQAKF